MGVSILWLWNSDFWYRCFFNFHIIQYKHSRDDKRKYAYPAAPGSEQAAAYIADNNADVVKNKSHAEKSCLVQMLFIFIAEIFCQWWGRLLNIIGREYRWASVPLCAVVNAPLHCHAEKYRIKRDNVVHSWGSKGAYQCCRCINAYTYKAHIKPCAFNKQRGKDNSRYI